ncbi:HNH endonuclease [Hydrogenophaga aromaticivorans]|uniref:HNH endonuclease n=1 Tax=Hydrogenophaga aromaticivorans TaxID=2610898 RepID=UPI001B3588E3|nr:HNH endonuclease [Hydrogenophaga aromaticivorans]MBQ0917007.1 HNH endonuclease [Hydrogenophaga aromaticivorans]
MQSQVLQLDIQGTPQAWISPEQAALHYATEDVAWTIGDEPLVVLRGGYNARMQRQSTLAISPIIALRGQARVNLFDVEPTVTRRKLFSRDRHSCGYCGQVFDWRRLQVEHIIPESRGGLYRWQNLCSSCAGCNARKGARTPEEAGMPLLYVPYVPSRFEDFLLQGRNIRADVHSWLAARLPAHSRLH